MSEKSRTPQQDGFGRQPIVSGFTLRRPAERSWWIDCSREELQRQAHAQQSRMGYGAGAKLADAVPYLEG